MNKLLGVFNGMNNAEYHHQRAIGSSGLKLIARSPFHYWSEYLNPARPRREPTPAQRLGTAWHAAIFEPAKFDAQYISIPEGLDRRTKEGKALWLEIEASGKQPLSVEDTARINAMVASAASHPVSRVIFAQKGGVAEASFFHLDPDTGAHCKIRPDYYVPPCELFPGGLLVDGKTGEDMSPAGFAKYAWNWELHIQAAFYCDIFQAVHGNQEAPAFVWLAQEKDAPYSTAYYSASMDFLAYGRRQYRNLLRTYVQCVMANHWPGYPEIVQPLELPAWAAKQVQEGVAA